MISADELAANLARLQDRISGAGGDPARVQIVAVTKAFPAPVVALARTAGLADLGENYAQELLEKVAAATSGEERVGRSAAPGSAAATSGEERVGRSAAPGSAAAGAANVRWHFLGRLQTNKVRQLAPHIALWQSVDRPALADEIAKRAPGAAILVQVNLSGEPQKGGCPFAELTDLVARAGDRGLDVRGLMGVGPAGDASLSRPGFERLVSAADDLGLPVRSIGMSGDLEVAVACGATMVRVGQDLFGPRPVRPTPSESAQP